MNSKHRMPKVMSGERVTPPPVVLHSWGDYKIELAGIDPSFQNCAGGVELTDIERGFYEQFHPDWIHLGSSGWQGYWGRERKVEDGRASIRSADGERWIEIRDDYTLADSDVPWAKNDRPRLSLESVAEIDEFFEAQRYTEQDILESGRFDHMATLSREYGEDVLIVINDGAPGCGLPDHSFEDALIACVQKPDLVAHAIYRSCEAFLSEVRAAKAAGAHAYIFSEGFGGSLDMLSPEMHERLESDTKRWFYSEVRKIGLLPIGYFLGDVRPNMGFINGISDMAALMIEEDKKSFVLDPTEIRQQLSPRICLIGNLDSALLLHGNTADIRAEVRRQSQAAEYGAFVVANGSPLIIGTPVENIEAYLDEARTTGG